MNYQNNVCCCRSNRCLVYAIFFLVLAAAIGLGLILGAVYYETIFPALAALIAFTAAVAVIIIALLIYYWCRKH